MNLKQFLELCTSLDICTKNEDVEYIEYIFQTLNAITKLKQIDLHLLSQIIEDGWELQLFEDSDIIRISFHYKRKIKR